MQRTNKQIGMDRKTVIILKNPNPLLQQEDSSGNLLMENHCRGELNKIP